MKKDFVVLLNVLSPDRFHYDLICCTGFVETDGIIDRTECYSDRVNSIGVTDEATKSIGVVFRVQRRFHQSSKSSSARTKLDVTSPSLEEDEWRW